MASESVDVAALADALGAGLLAATAPGEAPVVVVAGASLLPAARLLVERGYNQLTSVTAVDYLDAEARFQVVYHFTAVPRAVVAGKADVDPADPARRLRLKVPVTAEEPVVDSLVDLFPGANWHEREVWDMFGIEFAGHPDPRRILMPEDYEGHPLRKDHPLGYEEVVFSHNREAVYSQKHFPRE